MKIILSLILSTFINNTYALDLNKNIVNVSVDKEILTKLDKRILAKLLLLNNLKYCGGGECVHLKSIKIVNEKILKNDVIGYSTLPEMTGKFISFKIALDLSKIKSFADQNSAIDHEVLHFLKRAGISQF